MAGFWPQQVLSMAIRKWLLFFKQRIPPNDINFPFDNRELDPPIRAYRGTVAQVTGISEYRYIIDRIYKNRYGM